MIITRLELVTSFAIYTYIIIGDSFDIVHRFKEN